MGRYQKLKDLPKFVKHEIRYILEYRILWTKFGYGSQPIFHIGMFVLSHALGLLWLLWPFFQLGKSDNIMVLGHSSYLI